MPSKTLQCAMLSYTTKAGDVVRVFRGEVHDFPQEVYDQHKDKPHIFLEADEELPIYGQLFDIHPETVTDEELKAWVVNARTSEIAELLAENPGLTERVQAAQASIIDTRAAATRPGTVDDDTGLSVAADGLTTAHPATDVDATGVARTTGTVPPTGTEKIVDMAEAARIAASAGTDGTEADDLEGDEEDITEAPDNELTPEDVVAHNGSFVVAYLGRNPEMAEEIAEAEDKRTRGPRQEVIRALQQIAARKG